MLVLALEVNKIQRLGRILDDKVEVFDDLQRRMEELNANARMLGTLGERP